MLVPALTNGPDFRHSRVASGDLADITPTQPTPIKREGFRMFGTVGAGAMLPSRRRHAIRFIDR
jgi:penicillin V acylase-like amidase (Ntn superfamily)